MKHAWLKTTLLCTALLPFGLTAEELDERWYLAPSATYLFADEQRRADDTVGGQLSIGKPVSERWNVELAASADRLERKAGGEFEQAGLALDSLYFFTRNRGFAPYLTVGMGLLRTEFARQGNTHTTVSAGLGFMSRLNDYGLALRSDARYRMDNDNSSISTENGFGDWLINVGLVIPFGSQHTHPVIPVASAPVVAAPVVPAPTNPTDSDNDGVIDSADRCPGTVPGVQVDVDSDGCEPDGDNDGVANRNDQCPSTPRDVKVDAKGCELDSDNDGIIDSKDQCPNTKAGIKVDNKGCELQAVIKLDGVKFAYDSARLDASSLSTLDNAAETLRRHGELKVEVAGHTDNRGDHRYNVKLSQQRAEAVMNYLIANGINTANLSAKGYGPSAPIANNATASGRADNRRVELRIVGR